ncbi:MAG TPA: gas vesicle protein GvpJ [Terriglobales bacterium]|nr:gas vesicle protein GvpJ [Terriglobales bacterium]
MDVERASSDSSLADMYDRVLDKGIVIDAWMRISLAGLDLVHINMRVVVASIDTYLTQASALAMTGAVSPPIPGEPHLARNPRQPRRRHPRRVNHVE